MAPTLDMTTIRNDFPILNQEVHGHPLVYLDNAATSQKPRQVLQAIRDYYEKYNSNIHRGVHHLSEVATSRYEAARDLIAEHLNADREEINFVRGSSEAINLVAQTWGRQQIKAGDVILVSEMEHHSNIVPWQMLAEERGARVVKIPVLQDGTLDQQAYHELLKLKVKAVAIAHTSNAIGTVHPVADMIRDAHAVDAIVLVDAAQGVPHAKVDVRQLDCDFLCFSGHKVYAPTGIGVLYGKAALLDSMPPWQGGGEMIAHVRFSGTTYNSLPYKFEAGTPNICGGIALGRAIEYVREIGLDTIASIEHDLVVAATKAVESMDGGFVLASKAPRSSVVSFNIDGIHPYDIGVLLDKQGIAIRTGHHCAEPVMDALGIEGTCRASFAVYNTPEEVARFADGLKRAVSILRSKT